MKRQPQWKYFLIYNNFGLLIFAVVLTKKLLDINAFCTEEPLRNRLLLIR